MAACLATGGVLLSLMLLAGTASAQQAGVPTLSAVPGQPFNASGSGSELLDGSCTDLRNALVNWRDGTESPPSGAGLIDAGTVDVGGTPIPVKRVSVTVSHVFPIAALYEVSLSYDVTCDSPGGPVDFHEDHDPLFNVDAQGGCTAGAGPVHVSQASCGYNTYYGDNEKQAFRYLAKLAYQGYVFDKVIDDFISKWTGETWITENIVGQGDPGTLHGVFKDFVTGKFYGKLVLDKVLIDRLPKKLGSYAWMLDAPKYASYLDYVKYAVLTRLADDPPDPNFTALASPPKLRALRGAPRQVGKRDRREAALYIALLTTVERAGGAQVAGDSAAESAQLRHAGGIANQLVSLLGAKQKALKAAARTVKRIPAGRLPRGVVRRAKRRLDPRSLTPALRKLGFTDDEIAAVAQSAPSVPLKRLTAPFPQVLQLGAQAKAVGAERAALATFANRYAAGR